MIAFNFSLRALLFTALLTLTGGAQIQAGNPASLPSGLGMPEAVATDPNFITRWNLQPGETAIRFNLERAGAVNYTWETVPAVLSGFGTFVAGSGQVNVVGLPAGATIRLSIAPDNLRRIFTSLHMPSRQALVDVENWGTTQWTSMESAFSSFTALTGFSASDEPDLSQVNSMSNMFSNATNFNGHIGDWDVSEVTEMVATFASASAFNQNLDNWDVAKVTVMNSMFQFANSFNGNIGNWDVSAVTRMGNMFNSATAFNQSLHDWDVSGVDVMDLMFFGTTAFNQDLGSWTLNSDAGMTFMLENSGMDCANYSATLIGWSNNPATPNGRNMGAGGRQYSLLAASARTNLISKGWTISGDATSGDFCSDDFITQWTFPAAATQIRFNALTEGGAVDYTWTASPSGNSGNGSFTQAAAGAVTISGLSIASGDVVTLSMAPEHLRRFYINNGPDRERLTDVLQWGTVGWTSMSSAFRGCSNLNITATDIPNLSGVSSMAGMFRSCTTLNGPANIGTWNTGTVTDMSGLFFFAIDFNQPIGGWNTGTVETMDFMFRDAEDFNQPIGDWETGMVTNMGNMFNGATAFNQPIGDWDMGMVNDMAGMFQGATAFDQPIGDWDTGAATSMSSMFQGATAFNQPIGTWNTVEVRSMSDMFQGATAFNYPVGTWTLNSSVFLFSMLSNSGMDCANYSATLIGWAGNNPTVTGRSLGANGLQYGTNATAARDLLTVTRGWTISGDSPASGTCFNADDFITEWTFPAAATQIRFNALTEGGAVDYTWTASPSGNSGSGSFTQAAAGAVTLSGLTIVAGDVVTLSMAPENLRRFYIGNGADRERLTDVLQWGTVGWTSMRSAFRGCSNLNITAMDIPDLSMVSDMNQMFRNCTILNGPANIGNWDTDAVTDMSRMFNEASAFNRPIGDWETGTVTDMSRMFSSASAFNQPIGDWETGAVTEMDQMFRDASSFNQPIGDWNTGAVTSMSGMFDGATAFNQPIEDWDVSEVLQMFDMFQNASAFNAALNNWDVSKVQNMLAMFRGASSFDQNINDWDVSNVGSMAQMFQGASSFNQNINDWDVSNVGNMSSMFQNASNFNQNINDWDVSSVDNMVNMFREATNFNQSLNGWDVSSVSKMQGMFQDAAAFNGEIQDWDVSGVTSMSLMFQGAISFNQPLDNWNVSNVNNVIQMFRQASNFNQSLGNWTLNPNALTFNMLNDSGLDCENYSATLIGWSNNPATPDGRTLGADGMQYGTNAEAARDNLLSKGWTINGDAASGIPCTDFALSGNIVWEHDLSTPVPDATVTLTGDDTGSDDTDANGDYAIPTAGGNSLTLKPAKTTGNPYEGVDAADVTRIQQHVTFIDRFDDGYKTIAADVNQSNSVTGLDAAIVFHALNGNPNAAAIFEDPAWRFVDSTHTFMDENTPWPFPDTIALMNVMADVINQSFVGIKMGDVNGTWGAPLAPLAAPLNWTVPNQTLKAGQRIRVPFRASGLPDVAAWQFALRFDTDYLRFERALPTAAFPLKDENFGAWQADAGELRSVFAVPQGLVLPKDEVIFELEFQVVYDGLQLSEVLSLDNGILDGRVYNTVLDGGAVALAFAAVETRGIASLLPGEAALGFALEQNIPNPFGNETLVRFQLPEAGEAVFSVHDVQGRLLYEQRGFFNAGLHEVRLDAAQLGAAGVLSYTLRCGAHSATRRMVVVRR